MNDYKLITTLRTFSVYELNQFSKFINSPYFNVNQKITDFYGLIVEYLKKKEEIQLSKQEIFKDVFPEENEYQDDKFRKLNTDLLKLVEEFMALSTYNDNELSKYTYLLEALKKRKLVKLYKTRISKAQTLSERQLERSSSFYFFNYQLEKIIFEITEFDIKRTEKTNIDAISENLDIFYITEKLKLYADMVSRKKFASHEYKMLFIDEILHHLESNDYSSYPTVSIYFQILKSQIEPDNTIHYYELKHLISQHIDKFETAEGTQILGSAMNYCVGQINANRNEFLKEFFELMKGYLDKEFYFEEGKLNPFVFKNIIVTGLRLKEYNFVEDFIFNYKNKLPEDFQENAISYNLAQLYFYKKEFKKVLLHLTNLEYSDISYNLGARSLLIATYYELSEYDPLQSSISSFAVYLSRAKGTIPEKRRISYLNYTKMVKNMSNLPPNNPKQKKKLIEKFEKSEGIASAIWLKEKINEL
jgi:hypothetical protein